MDIVWTWNLHGPWPMFYEWQVPECLPRARRYPVATLRIGCGHPNVVHNAFLSMPSIGTKKLYTTNSHGYIVYCVLHV